MKPYLAVNMIVGENTNIGMRCTQASLSALDHEAIDEIVVGIHPRASSEVSDWVMDEWNPEHSVALKMYLPQMAGGTFAAWRNQVLSNTSKHVTHFIKVDADEVYYPDALSLLKREAGRSDNHVFCVDMFHLMRTPKEHQPLKPPQIPVMFKKPGRLWVGDVHEHVKGYNSGRMNKRMLNTKAFVHWGYTYPEVVTTMKALVYYDLEDNLDFFKWEQVGDEKKPFFRDWRTPDNGLHDRPTVPVASSALRSDPYLVDPWVHSGKEWADWLRHLDPEVFEWYEQSVEAVTDKEGNVDWPTWVGNSMQDCPFIWKDKSRRAANVRG